MLLFEEIRPAEQLELPFEKITDEQFWEGLTKRFLRLLDAFLRRTREQTKEHIFAVDLLRAVLFLDMCRRHYDVVATNPPYMHNRNIGRVLKAHLKEFYDISSQDLYACFLVRCLEFSLQGGLGGIVLQQSFMFLKSYECLRSYLLSRTALCTCAHLGPGAFSEIGGVKVNVILGVFRNQEPHRPKCVFIRVTDDQKKPERLLTYVNQAAGSVSSSKYIVPQSLFSYLPGTPLAYWTPHAVLSFIKESHTLSEYATNANCTKTGDNQKFLRYWWEVKRDSDVGKKNLKWVTYTKGGPPVKWYGNLETCVDWSREARDFYRRDHVARITEQQYWYKEGITFSLVGIQFFAARHCPPGCIFDMGGPNIIPDTIDLYTAIGIMNTRLSAYIIRLFNPTINFQINDVLRIPIPEPKEVPNIISRCSETSMACMRELAKRHITAPVFTFLPIELSQARSTSLLQRLRYISEWYEFFEALKSCAEGIIEETYFKLAGIKETDKENILKDVGTASTCFPLIKGYDFIPTTPYGEFRHEVNFESLKLEEHYLSDFERVEITDDRLAKLNSYLQVLYILGPDLKTEDTIKDTIETDEDLDPISAEHECYCNRSSSILNETFLEDLSAKIEVHPISVYWLLKKMRDKEELFCWPESKRYVEDYFTAMILRMLGFRWPKQIEVNEPIPDWADQDGIIPITEHTGERTLFERIRDRIGAEFGEDRIAAIEAEFADILFNAACKEAEVKGKRTPKKKVSLGQWLEKEFFKRHTSQFKKRPIAWHLTSSGKTFHALLFCHKISLDMLKNLKNRYLAKVQSYYGTLLDRARRGESVPDGLTAGKLSDIDAELEEFASKLDKLISMPYEPLIDDGVRVNIAPLQKLGLLASPVLATKEDVDRAIADRNRWREDDKEQDTVWDLKSLS